MRKDSGANEDAEGSAIWLFMDTFYLGNWEQKQFEIILNFYLIKLKFIVDFIHFGRVWIIVVVMNNSAHVEFKWVLFLIWNILNLEDFVKSALYHSSTGIYRLWKPYPKLFLNFP